MQIRLTRVILCLLLGLLSVSSIACKGKKKKAEEAARQEALAKQQIANEQIEILERLIKSPVLDENDLQSRRAVLQGIIDQNPTDPSVRSLIRKVDLFLQDEADRLRREAQEAIQPIPIPQGPPEDVRVLAEDFEGIAQAGDADLANRMIGFTLQKFASPNTPVLIAVYRQGDVVDYDEPTTITKFLNYLKDQGRNPFEIHHLEKNVDGQITLVELDKR